MGQKIRADFLGEGRAQPLHRPEINQDSRLAGAVSDDQAKGSGKFCGVVPGAHEVALAVLVPLHGRNSSVFGCYR